MAHALPSFVLWYCHKYGALLNWWDTRISSYQRSVLSHTRSCLDLPGGGGGGGCGRRGRLGCLGEPGELPLLCGEVWGGSGLMTDLSASMSKMFPSDMVREWLDLCCSRSTQVFAFSGSGSCSGFSRHCPLSVNQQKMLWCSQHGEIFKLEVNNVLITQ